jgi:hypothetical protein
LLLFRYYNLHLRPLYDPLNGNFFLQESAEFANEKPLVISGAPDSIERAKSMVYEILNQDDVRHFGQILGSPLATLFQL